MVLQEDILLLTGLCDYDLDIRKCCMLFCRVCECIHFSLVVTGKQEEPGDERMKPPL